MVYSLEENNIAFLGLFKRAIPDIKKAPTKATPLPLKYQPDVGLAQSLPCKTLLSGYIMCKWDSHFI